jgi:hypothetical protein
MKRFVPLVFTWPPVLEQIIIIGENLQLFYAASGRAAAPKLLPSFGERICTSV